MAIKRATKSRAKKAAKADASEKQVLSIVVSLADWDLEESYVNDAHNFWVGQLRRKGWASYKVIAFGEMAAALVDGIEEDWRLRLGIVHKRNQDGEWETILRVDDAGTDLPDPLPF